jgi:penicillin-binding protein 2
LRLSILGIVMVSLFVALLGRVWYLQVMNEQSGQEVTTVNEVRTIQIPPMRGRIVDRVGRVLADNKRTLVVTVDRKMIRRQSARVPLFTRLAGALGTTPEELEKRRNDARYDPLLPLPVAEGVDESIAVYLRERQEDYPGVEVTEGWQRVYRYSPVASHIVGYVGRIPDTDEADEYRAQGYLLSDIVGRSGIEMSFESDLRGTPGYVKYEVDANNRVVQEVERVDPIPGRDVQLAIDLKVQQYAEQILEAGLKEARARTPKDKPGVYFKAPAGSLVVEDPRNGEILAMASNPPFDNRFFVGGVSQAKYEELFGETSGNPQVNRAIQGQYQLGSTMKMFTSVAALNSGIIPYANYEIDDKGTYVIPKCADEPSGCEKKNAGGAIYGKINLPEALLVSSDVYFYGIGNDMWTRSAEGQNILQDEVRNFGLGAESGIDLPFEQAGIVPTREVKADLARRGIISEREGKNYYTGDNIQLAIGQGLLSVTPLQLVNGYATFANGGTHFRPLIALRVLTPGTPDGAAPGMVDLSQASDVTVFQPEATGHVSLAPNVYQPILQGLIGVLRGFANGHKGTGVEPFRTYNYDAFPIAGKTGTAQDATKLDEKDSSLFVGFGPVKAGTTPQYTVGAVLEQAGYGSWSAAPVVRCMFEAISGQRPMAEPVESEPLDKQAATKAAVLPPVSDTSCLVNPPTPVND